MSYVTVYDVARLAEVSIATVSRVLNSPDKVNQATRERVLAAIDALGFVPKAEAAARARKSSGRIAVLAPFFTFPSFVERLRGVAAALTDSPYELVIYSVDNAARRDAELASLAVTRRADGLIVMALPFGAQVASRMTGYQLPLVLVEFSDPAFSSIEINNEAGARLAAEHFIAQGRQRCAFIGDSEAPEHAIHPSDQRLVGYRAALEEAGRPLTPCYINLGPHGLEPAVEQTHRLLDLAQPPDAIFAASDTQALGALKAARQRGVRVPDDLAIIGFDDLEIADYIGLTTIRQPLQESGRIAVELLLARIADPSRHIQHIVLPLTLVRRETA